MGGKLLKAIKAKQPNRAFGALKLGAPANILGGEVCCGWGEAGEVCYGGGWRCVVEAGVVVDAVFLAGCVFGLYAEELCVNECV